MIRLNNVPDISTYISGNYITIANGNPTTLTFSETDNSCPSTVTPSTVSISGTLLNLTTLNVGSLLNCNPDPNITYSDTFYYEVINPKVIYQRNDKNSNITFIDVTAKQTYNHSHNIPVNNNTWLQNPNIVNNNLGRIIIERYNETTLAWDSVGSMPLNGTLTLYSNLTGDQQQNCLFRSRYIIRERQNCGGTSPIIFEAEGEEFELTLKYYEEDNLYIKQVLINDTSKFNLCEQDPTDFLTIEVDNQFEVFYDSYNIDYVYQYLNSSSSLGNTPLLNLSYNEPNRSVVGSILNISPRQPITNVNVEFVGCQNIFLDGILETNPICIGGVPEVSGDFNCNDFNEDFYRNCSGSNDPSIVVENKDLLIEGVRPNIGNVTQEDCTYCLNIEDNTIIENPCLKGKVLYQYKTSLNGEWCEFNPVKEIYPLSNFTHCFCDAGTIYIRNKYKYFEEHKCGCGPSHDHHEDILFETGWYEYTLDVLEFKPNMEATIINNDGCCTILEYINQEDRYINIVPSILELNNYFCEVTEEISTNPSIRYNLELYSQKDKIWEIVDQFVVVVNSDDYNISSPIITDSNILESYGYSIDKDTLEQGAYRVRYEIINCCYTTENVIYINICDSLTIHKDCDLDNEEYTECDCYKYIFNNYSPTYTYTVEVYDTHNDVVVDTLIILPNTELEYNFLEDSIYTLNIRNDNGISTIGKYTNPYSIPIFVFCAINKCYTSLSIDVLCSHNADCDCEDEDLLKDRFRLNRIMMLYQSYMRLIEKEYYLTSRYNIIDITNRMKTFKRLNKIYEQLKNLCEPCNNGTRKNCCG